MKKVIVGILILILFGWNVYLTYQLQSTKQTTSSIQSDHLQVIENTIQGYTTDITSTVDSVTSKVVSVKLFHPMSSVTNQSGMIYQVADKNVYILTSASDIEDDSKIMIAFDNAVEVEGTLVGKDLLSDVAVVACTPAFEVSPVSFTDTSSVKDGEYVISITGRISYAKDGLVQFGVVSSSGQTPRTTSEEKIYYLNTLQTDIELTPNNVGSPIFNLGGQVIGMMSKGVKDVQSVIIGGNECQYIANKMIAKTGVVRTSIGVNGLDISKMNVYQKNSLSIPLDQTYGIYVNFLEAQGAGQQAGMQVGDILVSLDGKSLTDYFVLSKVLYDHQIDETVAATVLRQNEKVDLSVVLK